MTDRLPMRQDEIVGGEVVDEENIAERIFEQLELTEHLVRFLGGEMGEAEIEALLFSFSGRLSELSKDKLDVPLYRAAFEHLTRTMDAVAAEKFEKPPGFLRKKKPARTYIRMLDDRYWQQQFPEQYTDGGMTVRQEGESDQDYKTRYVYACMHGLLFAPFTYLQDYPAEGEKQKLPLRKRIGKSALRP